MDVDSLWYVEATGGLWEPVSVAVVPHPIARLASAAAAATTANGRLCIALSTIDPEGPDGYHAYVRR